MGFSKKSGKGLVASSLVLSAVAPQVMGAQAVSFKGVKQGITSFFMRTFYFWYARGSYIKKLETKLLEERQEFIEDVSKDIKDLKDGVELALKDLGYNEENVFSEEFRLADKVLSFIKSKNEYAEKLLAQDNPSKFSFIYDCSKALNILNTLVQLYNKKDSKKYSETVESNQDLLEKVLKYIFKNEDDKQFVEEGNDANKLVFSENMKKFIVKKFIPKLEGLILSRAKDQNYIENNSKYDGNVFKKIFERSEKDFLKAQKEENEIKGKMLAPLAFLLRYEGDFKTLVSLNQINLNSLTNNKKDVESSAFWEARVHGFNKDLKKLKELKRNKVYYTGNLDIFNE